MDRALDEIIGDRPQKGRGRAEPRRAAPPPPRGPRREEYPRDGIRKNRYDERVQLDTDWVHDRYEDEDARDRGNRHAAHSYERHDRAAPRLEENGAKIKVDNIHYELTEPDLRELFQRIGPVVSVRLLYDRMDRSEGTAFVTYQDPRDARDAITEFNGCNANGQPIRLTMLPTAPAAVSKGNLFDRVERPTRSLFDRIAPSDSRDDGRGDGRDRRRRNRSESPPRTRVAPAPENVDRYVPGERRSRSPIKRRGTPREPGRRPGQRREDSGRGPARRGRTDEDGRPLVGGRPRKTAEELDAEMADYWGKGADAPPKANGAGTATEAAPVGQGTAAAPAANPDDDIDMIE